MSVTLSPITPDEVDDVQAVIESDPGYVERVTGLPPGPADAQSVLMMRPPDLPEEHKIVYGVRCGTQIVGLIDVLRGYPERGVAYIGLLQIRGDLQRQGLGRAAHDELRVAVRDWPEVRRLRLSVVATNGQVETFWRSLGYEPAGPPVPYTYANLHSTAQRFERAI